jgi:hypothetical protein
MAHSAAAPSNEQYLQIEYQQARNTGEQSVIFNALPSIESPLFDQVSPLYYKTRVRLSFSLSEEFKKHFVLVKGLIEFHRSTSFAFEYSPVYKIIETDIEVSGLGALQQFLDNVLTWTNQEISFKRALKLVLDFENRYKIAKAEAYAQLLNLTPPNTAART